MLAAPIDDGGGGGYPEPQISVSITALNTLEAQAAADAQKVAAQQATLTAQQTALAQQTKLNTALQSVIVSNQSKGVPVAAGDNGLGGLGDIVPGTDQSAQDLLNIGYSGDQINALYAQADPSLSSSQLDVASSTSGNSMGNVSSLIKSAQNLGYSVASAVTGRPIVNTAAGYTLGNTPLLTSSNFTMILLLGGALVVFVMLSRKG